MELTRVLGQEPLLRLGPGGMESRRNIDSALSSGQLALGGWPRPSLKWQLWQEREL